MSTQRYEQKNAKSIRNSPYIGALRSRTFQFCFLLLPSFSLYLFIYFIYLFDTTTKSTSYHLLITILKSKYNLDF